MRRHSFILLTFSFLLSFVAPVLAQERTAVRGYKLGNKYGSEVDSIEVVIKDVEVGARRRQRREHYRRKGNTAVDIMRETVARKYDNLAAETDTCLTYDKLTLGVSPFDYTLQKTKLRRSLQFVKEYVDTAVVDSMRTPYLDLSMRELIYREQPDETGNKQLYAQNWRGVDRLFDLGGISENINYLFQPVNIRDDNVEMLMNKFVSPLSSTLWNSYYHYYLLDTVMIDGVKCYDMGFAAANAESYGFTGHLYITTDSTFALKGYRMRAPMQSNMNWVSGLQLEQRFTQSSTGEWMPQKATTETLFSIRKRSAHQIFARQTKQLCTNETATLLNNDSVEGQAKNIQAYWDALRPEPLTKHEQLFDSLTPNLMRVKTFAGLVKTYNILVSEYIPTTRDLTFRDSKWDFGPIYNTASYNGIEGWRVRVGGMTTANLHPHFFVSTYVAYGFRDKRPKGNLTLVYSFNKKQYHYRESFRHAITLSATYDMEQPCSVYGKVSPDHIFNTLDPYSWVHPENWNRRLLYVGRTRLMYEKEWVNRFRITTWGEYEHSTAAGDLQYLRLNADGSYTDVKRYQAVSYTLQFRYAPGEPLYNNRRSVVPNTDLNRNAPVFTLTHQVGYMLEDGYVYNRSEAAVEYRWWLASFGYIDMLFRGGMVWDRVPYPKLFTPPTNRSFFLDSREFNMMRRMEFFMDKYAMWHITYNMKGWLLNRIPGINKLKLRGVVSFCGVWGGLDERNDPNRTGVGLYAFPQNTKYLDKYPYMEFSVGIDNIFRFFRVDYFRRLNYNAGLSGWEKNGVKIVFHTDI